MSGFSWALDDRKFLSAGEVDTLRRTAARRRRVKDSLERDVRAWFALELGLAAGLRLMEMAALCCGDLRLNQDRPEAVVRKGKDGKRRVVLVGRRFQLRAR